VLSLPLRPTDPGALFHYDRDSAVVSYAAADSKVRVHYATRGRHATILDDLDGDGVPDLVALVAVTADRVLEYWAGRGFLPPLGEAELRVADDGGDERLDIYLVDFDISADGHFATDACTAGFPQRCAGHMVMENDFAEQGYANLREAVSIITSHELFHAIQAAYAAGVSSWWTEATAVWAEEEFDPAQSDFEGFLDGFFSRPDRSLDSPLPGPVDPFSYGLAIFPRFLGERFGPETVRRTWEELALDDGDPPDAARAVDAVLRLDQGSSLSAAYAEFARWNMFTGRRADPARSYAEGRRYPQVALELQAPLPWTGDFRLFHLASRYVSLRTGGRTQVAAALLGGDPGQLQLTLLALQPGGRPGELRAGDPLAPQGTLLTLDTTGAERVLLLASNTSIDGQSVRPPICAGSPEEVEACLDALAPPDVDGGSGPDATDAGAGAADGGADASEGAADGGTQPAADAAGGDGPGPLPPNDSGGETARDAAWPEPPPDQPQADEDDDGPCAMSGTSGGAGWSWGGGLLILLLLLLRRPVVCSRRKQAAARGDAARRGGNPGAQHRGDLR